MTRNPVAPKTDYKPLPGGARPHYEWNKFFWYPAGFPEGVESALTEAAKELIKGE